MMLGVPVVRFLLGANTMMGARSHSLHASQTPSGARQDKREHREKNQYGAGSTEHADGMIWSSNRIARPLKNATRLPPEGHTFRSSLTRQ
jgi:hypothetical protein